jgi:mono/diheme cytochrome c family protein
MFRLFAACGVASLALLGAFATADDAQIDKGKAVFAAQKCSMCHSIAGKGNPKGSLERRGLQIHAGRDPGVDRQREADGSEAQGRTEATDEGFFGSSERRR